MFEHRKYCEFVQVPKWGICTCDFDARMIASRHVRQLTDEEILMMDKALISSSKFLYTINGK